MTGPGAAPVVAVVGPTAAGKSGLAVALAQHLGAEIVNADAMALYRGMDIGTAKPDAAERGGVPHHLFDLWSLDTRASVADYAAAATAVLDRLTAAGVPAVVVGGSGLYLTAVLHHLDIPPTDPAVRAALEARLAAEGPAALHAELAARDPAAAAPLLATNGRRVVRALEVLALTGAVRTRLPVAPPWRYPGTVVVGVAPPDLAARIDTRVHRMFDRGLVAEVRALEAQGLRTAPTAAKALGYAQVLADPAADTDDRAARAATALATRQFARRQRSWFRRDPRIRWLDNPDLTTALAALRQGSG